jgi:high affinity Mn2+ porin
VPRLRSGIRSPVRWAGLPVWAGAAFLIIAGGCAEAQTASQPGQSDPGENWSVHGQFTFVSQHQPAFRSPYSGGNSLLGDRSTKETADATLYLGRRLWQGAAAYLNPEIDQGFGLSNTLGVAGFPSGEAYKVGQNKPYLRLNRAFIRQVIPLGAETEPIEPAANTLGGMGPKDNVTITVGKFSVGDIFDGNAYAHDPRTDFLNWSIIEAGAFDYAADAWGFTRGLATEWQTGEWTFRVGLFAMSEVPNSTHIDATFGQRSWMAEAGRRYEISGLAGQARMLWYVNHGRMGLYDDAVNLAAGTGAPPDLAAVRRRGSKAGWALNLEQALSPEVGSFLRLSASSGDQEAFDFTEINRSISGGVALKGSLWGAPDHGLGVGLAINGLSGAARRYFAAGGLGILIGDGQLPNAGPEQILEAYYSVALSGPLSKPLRISGDFQRIVNPAYNRDRGPVSIYGVRLHAEF